MSGAVEEAAPPVPVESEIGKLVARIMAGETVIARGAPRPDTGKPRRYRLRANINQSPSRLLVSYRSKVGGKSWYVNGNEWNVPLRSSMPEALLEVQARAMLAAIFAGIPVCDFECGRQINSDLGDGIVVSGD